MDGGLVDSVIVLADAQPHERLDAAPAADAAPASTDTAPAGGDSAANFPCTGQPLTAQLQVKANTAYCGGVAHEQIRLASGDTWVNGEVTGAMAASQRGAVECGNDCTLVNMNVHDNPAAFASLYILGDNAKVIGGRFSGAKNLGLGDDTKDTILIDGAEIDHNNVTDANCGFEGGGIKFVSHHVTIKNSFIHDNGCKGVWFDINAMSNEIANNRVIDNHHEGIFYEISQDASIHDNQVEGNGFKTNGNSCSWLWGGGITVASSFGVEIFNNTLKNNCNGITGTQQDRPDSTPPAHLLDRVNIHDNNVTGSGKSGVVEDNGANLSARDIKFNNNQWLGGHDYCGTSC